MKKFLSLINPVALLEKAFQGVIVKRLVARGAKVLASGIVAFLATPKAAEALAKLTEYGFDLKVDPTRLQDGVAILLTALLLVAEKWAKVRFAKD